jgi:hypothetical protein
MYRKRSFDGEWKPCTKEEIMQVIAETNPRYLQELMKKLEDGSILESKDVLYSRLPRK